MKKKIDIFAEMEKLKETAPAGSVELLRNKLSDALDAAKLFGPESYAYLRYTFLDKIIVEAAGKVYQVSYMVDGTGVTFGAPEEVEEMFRVKESAAPVFEIVKEAENMDLNVNDFVNLTEAKYNPKSGEFENVILIEAGTNIEKLRHYPEQTIREAAPMFAGLKMYINHPTKAEEKERPERDVRDWVSTITESSYENGKAKAKVAIHDPWLKERLADPVFKKNIGLSINAGGKISIGLVEGQKMQIVEKIIPKRQNGSASVDWVTEAGARGRVDTLLESRREGGIMLEKITVDQIKKDRPDIVTAILESASADAQTMAQQLKEAQTEAAGLKRTLMLQEQSATIKTELVESKLPVAAQDRIFDLVKDTVFESVEKLKESIGAKITAEREYLSKFSTKGKINFGGAEEETSLVESVQGMLEAQMGIKVKEVKS